MAGSASRSLRLVGMVAAGAAVAAAAGCASSSGSSTSASAPAASSSSGPAASTSAAASPASSAPSASPAGSPRAAGTPTPSGAGSTSPGSPGSGLAGCATQDLQVKAGTSEGAAGSLYQSIVFTNVSSASCTLYGYPGVSLAAGSPAAQVGAAAARSTTAAPVVVTLAPGQTANALLRIVQALNYPQATCSPTATTSLRIYPPNETQPVLLPFKSTGCTSNSVKLLTIGVVQAGAGQQ